MNVGPFDDGEQKLERLLVKCICPECKYVGFSLSSCLKEIARGLVPLENVARIYSNTCISSPEVLNNWLLSNCCKSGPYYELYPIQLRNILYWLFFSGRVYQIRFCDPDGLYGFERTEKGYIKNEWDSDAIERYEALRDEGGKNVFVGEGAWTLERYVDKGMLRAIFNDRDKSELNIWRETYFDMSWSEIQEDMDQREKFMGRLEKKSKKSETVCNNRRY